MTITMLLTVLLLLLLLTPAVPCVLDTVRLHGKGMASTLSALITQEVLLQVTLARHWFACSLIASSLVE
jgi:hypothetical protein